MVNKSYIRTHKPNEQSKVEPSIAMVKDLLEEDIDGMLCTSEKKLLELLNLIEKINIDLLLACPSSQLK